MALIQIYSKPFVTFNLRRPCAIIISIILCSSFFVLVPTRSNTIVFTTPLLQTTSTSISVTTTSISVANSSTTTTTTEKFYPNIAVLVESRAVNQMITIVHNVNHHIPSSWPIQIFHGKDNEHFIRNSTLAPLIASGKVLLNRMAEAYDRTRTNDLLTNASFWKRVRGEKILFFQIDSAMCSNSTQKITDFLQYDYIGAPWDPSWYSGHEKYLVGNGGFSLRTRSKILTLLERMRYHRRSPEDVWYAHNMRRVNGSIPSVEIAKTFSVETVFYDRPVGVHRSNWKCDFHTKLVKTCPEAMLVVPNAC